MTRPIKSLAAFVATLALFYLFGAFVAWDWNAGAWHVVARFMGAFIALIVASAMAVVAGEIA